MSQREAVIERIHRAFGGGEYPGENFLQGSFDGCEPYGEVDPFKSKKDWRDVEADFLDTHADALSFFSEGAFRFFLPAYLIADLQGQLSTADPLFHLIHGFFDTTLELPTQGRAFVIKQGRSAFVNPRRYGATTFYDYARYRLSVFTREEASAIVAYLRFKRDLAPDVVPDRAMIDAALETFWLERADGTPGREPEAASGGAGRVPRRSTLGHKGQLKRPVNFTGGALPLTGVAPCEESAPGFAHTSFHRSASLT